MSNIIISALVCGALFAWIVFCAFSIAQRLYKACSLLYVSTTRAANDNDKAVQHFIDLLNEAKKKMTIYDDGNDMDGSAYKDTRVIDAVRRKLDQNPILRCSASLTMTTTCLSEKRLATIPG